MKYYNTGLMYNKDYKMLFRFNPSFQCIYGMEGYMLMMDVYTSSKEVTEEELKTLDVKFMYTQGKWNKAIKYIKSIMYNK